MIKTHMTKTHTQDVEAGSPVKPDGEAERPKFVKKALYDTKVCAGVPELV